jgi:hypothetical protein
VSSIALRPRSATEIVDAAFQLMKRYYASLVVVAVVALAPALVVRVILGTRSSDPVSVSAVVGVQFLSSALADAAIIVAVSDCYLGESVNVGDALARTAARLPAIIGASLIRWMLIAVSAVAPVIAFAPLMIGVPSAARVTASFVFALAASTVIGLYVTLRTLPVTAVIVLERARVTACISRAWGLTRGEASRIFVTLGLAWLIYLALWLLAGTTLSAALRSRPVLADILAAVVVAFVYPFIGVVTTLLYYDLRVRKEGFDLEMMAKELGVAGGVV